MRYNARKKVIIYIVETSYGEYGELIHNKTLYSEGTQLVCPTTTTVVKRQYGISTNNPKKIIYNKYLPKNGQILAEIEGVTYLLLDRTDFDKFNILLVDEVRDNG